VGKVRKANSFYITAALPDYVDIDDYADTEEEIRKAAFACLKHVDLDK
jgi:hypothetical protein